MPSSARPGRLRRLVPRLRPTPIGWFSLGVFAVYALYAFTRYRQMLTAGYDLGIFDQAVRRYAHFQAPLVPLKGDHFNLLGDHFHPILALWAPLYWIWDDPRSLLLGQAALLASSIPIVHGMLRRHLDSPRTIWAITLGYALGWPLQRMVDFDVHEIAFAIPLLALAMDGLDRRDDRRLLLGALPLLLVREDMGMVVLMIGLVRLLRGRDRRSLALGLGLAGLGAVVFVLVIKVVLPHFASDGRFAYWSYDALGPDAGSAIAFIVRHPIRTAELFVSPPTKSVTLLYLLVPLALLPLGSPYALITLPLLAQRFLSSRTNLWSTHFHYSGPIFVILVFAAIDTLSRLRGQWRRRLTVALVVGLLATPVIDPALGGSNHPLIRLFYPGWKIRPHTRDQKAMVALVPPNTCVEVDDRLAPRLTTRNRVTLPTLTKRASDFIVLDLSQKEVGFPLPSPQVVERDALAKGYTEVARRGQLTMLQRPGYAGPSAECNPLAPQG